MDISAEKIGAFKKAVQLRGSLLPAEPGEWRRDILQEALRDNEVICTEWGAVLPSPRASAALLLALADEFESIDWLSKKITFDDAYGCWAINLSREMDDSGHSKYPTVTSKRFNADSELAHRFVWRRVVDAMVPSTVHLDHLCRAHACCNPLHLEAVSPAENTKRGRAAVHSAIGQSTLPGLSLFDAKQ